MPLTRGTTTARETKGTQDPVEYQWVPHNTIPPQAITPGERWHATLHKTGRHSQSRTAHCGQRQIRIGKAGYNRSSKTISDAVSITAYQSTIKFCHRNIGSCRVSHGAGRFISLDFDMIGKADPGVTPLTPYHAKCNPTQTKHVCK